MVDVGIALATFAGSLGLLALGDPALSRDGGDYAILAGLLTALASLPLILRRRAPLAVFVLTAAARLDGAEVQVEPDTGGGGLGGADARRTRPPQQESGLHHLAVPEAVSRHRLPLSFHGHLNGLPGCVTERATDGGAHENLTTGRAALEPGCRTSRCASVDLSANACLSLIVTSSEQGRRRAARRTWSDSAASCGAAVPRAPGP